jgi:hypothetical protein
MTRPTKKSSPKRPAKSKPVRAPRTKSAQRATGTAKAAIRTSASTKQADVIAMLQSPTGATIPAMIQATGWQQHSVRGFLAGVVRKRLKLELLSEKVEGARTYRIVSPDQLKSDSRQTQRRPS